MPRETICACMRSDTRCFRRRSLRILSDRNYSIRIFRLRVLNKIMAMDIHCQQLHTIFIMDSRVPLLFYWYRNVYKKHLVHRRFWVHPLLETGPWREKSFEKFYWMLRKTNRNYKLLYNLFYYILFNFKLLSFIILLY